MITEQPHCRAWQLDEQSAPVRFARRRATRALADWKLDEHTDSAVLLVSELVTNAMRHGKPPVRLELSVWGDLLQVTVEDGSPDLPVRQEGGEDGGFGLEIAEALADISVHPRCGGKLVRALMPLTGGALVDDPVYRVRLRRGGGTVRS